MDLLRYLDFDLQLEHEAGRYLVQVVRSPAGEASAAFTLPFTEDRLENLILKMGPLRARSRGVTSEEQQAARELGAGLFESLFTGEVLACLRTSLDETNQQDGVGLRLKLRLQNVPELADLPWEFLFDRALNRFLAQSNYTPVVRYVELPERIRPLLTSLPLRILVMVSSPEDPDFPKLDSEAEKARLRESLAPLESKGNVVVDWLERATMPELQARLRQQRYHVFHYIGHGGFDPSAGEGVLILEDELGRSRWAAAHRIGPLLHDHRSLRLAVLNSCEGARNSRTDPFAGLAASLIQQGIPAVVAMQFEITDRAAVVFGSEFYAALVAGFPVDASVAEARKAILIQANEIEWGTPVLYMRSPDGVLFDFAAPPAERAPQAIDGEALAAASSGHTIVDTVAAPAVEPAETAAVQPADTPAEARAMAAEEVATESVVLPPRAEETEPSVPEVETRPLGLSLRPLGRGAYVLEIANPSQTSLEVSLSALAEADGPRIELPPSASLAPGSSTTVRLRARPRRRRWRGEARKQAFTITAAGSGGGLPPASVRGEFDDVPSPWLPLAGGGVFAAAGAVAAAVLLLNPVGGGAPPPQQYIEVDRLLFVSDRDGHEEVYAMDADGSNFTRLTASAWPNRLPTALGDLVVFVSERDGGSELYAMLQDGSEQRRIASTDGTKLEPNLSPDGRLAFEVRRGNDYEIYVLPAIDGGDAPKNISNNPAADIDPHWSPDGQKIAFGSDRSGNMEIYVMDADGSNLVRLTNNPAFDAEPAWSPDGQRILFESNRGGSFDLYTMNASDGFNLQQVTRMTGDEFDPSWSADGSLIAYTYVAANSRPEVYVQGLDGVARNVTSNPAQDVKPAWTRVSRPLPPTPKAQPTP